MGRRALSLVAVAALMVGLGACAHRSPEAAHQGRAVGTPPPPNSPLAKVQVGMSPREVEVILGPPNDENSYMTGKAFIPYFYGRDRWRRAYFYKGMGRVVFAGSGGFSASAHVSRVDYDPNEIGRAR
jgi:hypothetical protein